MSIKKLYYYLFYKIYKAIEYTSGPFGNFLISFKAGLVMIALEIWIGLSVINYYSVFTNTKLNLSAFMPIIYIPLVIIIAFNYYTLDYLNLWKKYNQEFDNFSTRKNIIGSWIVFGLILLIISNTILSFYCLDLKAKRNQTGPYAPEIVAKEKRDDSLQKAQQIENLKKIYGEDKK